MSDEMRVHVLHTWQAFTMAFTADAPVDLRFLVPLSTDPIQTPEYELPEGWRARYAPWELAPYVSISPVNLPDLLKAGRLVRYDATVRIDRQTEGASAGLTARTTAVEPQGSPPRYPLMERFTAPYAEWKTWHRTELDHTTSLEIPGGRTLEVEYRVPSEQVGQTVWMRCGETEAEALLIATGGTLQFRNFRPGTSNCVLNAPPGDYFAKVPGSGERWIRRNVYRADGGGLRASVPVERGRLTTVIVRVYTPAWAPTPTMRIKVDDGTPRRHGGPSVTTTKGDRKTRPDGVNQGAWLADMERGSMASHDGIKVVLGDDLSPGTHTVSAAPVFADGEKTYPVWVRFEATDAYTEEGVPENWSADTHCEMAQTQGLP